MKLAEYHKVLLIEDNAGDARLIRELLSACAPETYVAWVEDLTKGMAMLANPGLSFNALLLDLSLPDSYGFQTFAHIRAVFPNLPIIILTGTDDEEMAIRAVREGAQDYIVKGQTDGLLLARAIRYAIERRRVERALSVSEGTLASLAANFPGAVYRCKNDPTRTMEYISDGVREMTGYGPEEFIYNGVRSFASVILSEDSAQMFREIWKAMEERRPYTVEYRIRDASGAIKWIWERGLGVEGVSDNLLEGVITDITDRKEAEKAIRDSEERYRTIFENSLEGIYQADQKGKFLTANSALARMHGFVSPAELIEYTNNGLYQPFVKPDDRLRYLRILHEKGFVESFEIQVRRKDRNIIWVSMSARVVRNGTGKIAGYEGAVIDITDRKKALDLLRESEKRYKGLFDHANEAILLIRGSRFIDCNARTLEIFACTREEIIGEAPHTFSPPQQPDGKDSKKSMAERVRNAASGMPQLFEWKFIRKDGRSFDGEVSLSNIVLDDEVLVHALVRDITRRKEAEEMLHKAMSELETAHDELKTSHQRIVQQEKMASIGQLAAGVAHEINNPVGFIMSNLNAMNKYTERLLRFMEFQNGIIEKIKPGREDGGAFLAEINERKKTDKIDFILGDMNDVVKESLEGAERVKRIVQDLKSFSRVDEKEYKLADINNGLETTINVVWNELKYKATVRKEYGDLPKTKCNPGQLNQVFMNILVNAAHAIEEQGEIGIKTEHIGDSIIVTISDTGSGMPKEVQERIFEPFYTTKEAGKGTGLGLSIAYDIIKKHKGDISVQSEAGKGTTFTVTIPVIGEAQDE